ncbi:MAG TPA: hypothetical protein PKA76_10410 [Pirellulaceae bacterium]|nr:hypothetical protein [Pirellulaceae bacterium]
MSICKPLLSVTIIMMLLALAGGIHQLFPNPKDGAYPPSPFLPLPMGYPTCLQTQDYPGRLDTAGWQEHNAREREALNRLKRDTTSEESAALDALDAEKYIQARELAEAILRSNPQSISARFVRGVSMNKADGNAAAALHELRFCRRLLEKRGREVPGDEHACAWYLHVLEAESGVLRQLARDDEALLCVTRMEQVYGPLPWLKTWSLIRLKRYDEASETIRATQEHGGFAKTALNDRGALFLCKRQYAESLESFRQHMMLDSESAVAWSNYAGAALAMFQFAEAEKHWLEAAKRTSRLSARSYFLNVAQLYLEQRRLQESAEAVQMAAKNRAHRAPWTWRHEQGKTDLVLASLLAISNHLADAERIARRAYERPDQLGISSDNDQQRQLHSGFLLYRILVSRIAELQELEVASDNATQLRIARASLEAECWVLRRRLLQGIDGDFLTILVTPRDERALGPDIVGDFLRILPYGVASEVLALARSADERHQAAAYYDAFEAEMAFLTGDDQKCLQLAGSALAALPTEAEKGLFCRTSVIAAMAARRLGASTPVPAPIDPILDLDPGVFRRLGIAFPVMIQDDGSPAAAKLAQLLNRSIRLSQVSDGFPIRLSTKDGELRLDMLRSTDARYVSLTVEINDGDVEAASRSMFEQFHGKLATPGFALDQTSIADLEGTATGAVERNQLGNVVDTLFTRH